MGMENLSNDVKASLLGCDSAEELHELAKASGYELSDEELKGVSGGRPGNPGEKPGWDCMDMDMCGSF